MAKIDELESTIIKKHGKGSAILLSQDHALEVDLVSTGFFSLDRVLGGGVPKGRFIEIFGGEATGKTTLALHIAKQIIDAGGDVCFVDMEQALNGAYLTNLQLDLNRVLVSQPDNGDNALEIAETAVEAGISLVIIDSVDALVPKQEIDGDYGDRNMGARAQLIASGCRRLQPLANKTGSIVLWINQLRDNFTPYGGPVTPGGRSLKFYTAQRIQLSNIGKLKNGEDVYGNRVKFSVVKNKIAPPFKIAEMDLIFGEGFCRYSDVIDLAIEQKVIAKSGSWFSMGEEKIGHGRDAVKAFFKESPDLFTKLVDVMKEK